MLHPGTPEGQPQQERVIPRGLWCGLSAVACHSGKQWMLLPTAISHCSCPQCCALREFRMQKKGDTGSTVLGCTKRNNFTEPRLLHLPIKRTALKSLTWNVCSFFLCVTSKILWCLITCFFLNFFPPQQELLRILVLSLPFGYSPRELSERPPSWDTVFCNTLNKNSQLLSWVFIFLLNLETCQLKQNTREKRREGLREGLWDPTLIFLDTHLMKKAERLPFS